MESFCESVRGFSTKMERLLTQPGPDCKVASQGSLVGLHGCERLVGEGLLAGCASHAKGVEIDWVSITLAHG